MSIQKSLDIDRKKLAEKVQVPTGLQIIIYSELKEQGISDVGAQAIAGYFFRWKQERNPYQLDRAFLLLHDLGGTPTPTMLAEDADCRKARLEGSLAGTAESIKKENAESWVMPMMAYLVVSEGLSISSASRKAANEWATFYPDLKAVKASTLEQQYSQLKKHRLEEKNYQLAIAIFSKDDLERFKNTPDCSDDLVGNRR